MELDVVSPEKITIEKSLRLGFSTTNNEVKYGSLLVGMAMVQKIRGRAVEVFSDSRLVVGQVKGELEARDLRMQEYFTLQQIPRSRNMHVDSLAALATSLMQSLLRVILFEDLYKPIGIKRENAQIHQIRVGPSWMDSIVRVEKYCHSIWDSSYLYLR